MQALIPTGRSLYGPIEIRHTLVATCIVVMGGLALAGCQSSRGAFGPATINASAGSQVNIASLTQVVKQNPNDPGAYNVRGTAYGKAGDLKSAIADFDTAIKLNPSFYQAYANRALVERRQGRDDLAFNDYNKAIAIAPNYAPAYVGRGDMYRQRKQTDLALADFNTAIKLDATDPRAFHNRGLVEQALGRRMAAIADFSKAISIAPSAIEPYNARGLSYLATNDYRAALDDFNEVVKRERDFLRGVDQRRPCPRAARRTQEGFRRLRPCQCPQSQLWAGTRGHAPHVGQCQRRARRQRRLSGAPARTEPGRSLCGALLHVA